jgi:hypothetical protein
MIGQGRPTISAVVAAIVWLAGASWLAAQEAAAPVDRLRIIAHRDPLIFTPGEQFTFDLEPMLVGVEPSTTIDIAASLTSGGSATRWSTQQRLPVPFDGPAIATLHVPLPREEGVYEIHLAVTRPPGFRERFFPGGAGAPLVQRSFQVVVLDGIPKPPAPDAEWERVLEIDPVNSAWSTRLPDWTQIRRIPGVPRRPIGSVRTSTVKTPLGVFAQLAATTPRSEPHWQAFPLDLNSASGPHLLEVEYPNDEDQHLGISIVEPDSAGRFVTIGRDSGVYVEGLGSSERVERRKHRIVFWPHTKSPLVLITNEHPTAACRFGTIRVFKRTANTIAIEPWPTVPNQGRLVAAYLAKPVRGSADSPANQDSKGVPSQGNDWSTLYDGVVQLTEYLNYAGYNAVAINVMAEGGYLIPPNLLDTPSRHDVGPIAAESDMPAADGLELLLRVCDRVGLAVIPTLEFTAPLPVLESLRQQTDARSGGIELIGPGGLTWAESHSTEQGTTLRYNLLDPRVQQAALEVAHKVLRRYGRHPSLRSLAVQLSSQGYGVLPGLEWGLDDTTVGRFEHDTGIRLGANGSDRFDARLILLTGQHADAWRDWRAKQVTGFYQQMADQVATTGAKRELMLTTERLFDLAEAGDRLRPNVTTPPPVEQTMLEMGIDWQELCSTSGIAPLPTRFIASMKPLVDRAIDLSINSRYQSLAKPTPAALFYHRPRRQTFASLDALNPFAANAPLLTQSAAHDAAMREPYIAALVNDDPTIVFDGGDVVPLGQEGSVRDLRAILRALPNEKAANVQRENNVTLRTYQDRGQTIFLIVNECPWYADVTLDVATNMATTALPLVISRDGANRPQTEQFAAGRQLWSLQLAPYDVHAVRFTAAAPKIERIESRISDVGRQELAARVNELKERDLTAKPRYRPLANPGFEPQGGGLHLPLPGWKFEGEPAQANAELDATAPQEAQTCLYLQNRGQGIAAMVSDDFPVPETGQLAIWTFVRGLNVGPASSVRLVFEVDGESTNYRRAAVLGGNQPGAQPIAADWGRGYAFKQDDLPLDSRARMRLRFELTGPGDVWIDNVQLFDLLFPLYFYDSADKERLELVKLRAEAESELKRGEFAECVRTLDGYWPRFVNAYTPAVAPTVATQPPAMKQSAPTTDETPAESAPSVGKRWYQIWK